MEHKLSDDESHCTVCGLSRDNLTTNCPGLIVSPDRVKLISAGMIDCRYGVGWVVGPKRNVEE